MARTTSLHDGKTEFRNVTKGFLGVVTYAPNGNEKAIAVEPGGTVWLSEAEQDLTAKAPREAKDNPFIEQRVPVIDPETGDVERYDVITPLVVNDEVRPTPASRAREDAPEGSHDDLEEVGTPSAQSAPAKRRRRTAARA